MQPVGGGPIAVASSPRLIYPDENEDTNLLMPWGRNKKAIIDWLVPPVSENPVSDTRSSSDIARAFFDSNPAALDLKSVDGRYLFVNKAWSMLTGVSAKKALSGEGGPYYRADHVADSSRQHAEVVETRHEKEGPGDDQAGAEPLSSNASDAQRRHAPLTPNQKCDGQQDEQPAQGHDLTRQIYAGEPFQNRIVGG